MLNPLKIATDGYLKRQTKAVLTIAVAGYLSFGSPTPASGGGGSSSKYENTPLQKQLEENRKRIEQDNNDILLLVKTFLEQCQ